MSNSYASILELYSNTLKSITNNTSKWLDFITCAGINYKYQFINQVLIYSQKPDATACAKIGDWNKKLKRWINKNAKGIALIEEKNGSMQLSYVFDVSDTHYYNKKIGLNLWEINDTNKVQVIETLENKFGKLEDNSSFEKVIQETVNIVVQDSIQDYLEDLKMYKFDSKLENLSDEEIENNFKKLLNNTVSYMIMKRCNIDTSSYYTKEEFDLISNYNTYDTVTRLGIASSDISKVIINEIALTVRKIKEREKNKNRTFVEKENISYDKNKNERGVVYDNNLQQTRGLSTTKFNITKSNREENNWKIRTNENELSERTQKRAIYSIVNDKQINESLGGNSRNGNIRNRENSDSNGTKGTSNRRNESNQSNEMDWLDEQFENDSRRNSDKGVNLQLEKNIDISKIDSAYKEMSDEDIISILTETPYLQVSREEVEYVFEIYNKNERIQYLKDIFNYNLTELTIDNKKKGYKAYDNLVHFWTGSYDNRDTEIYFDWENIANYIDGLIKFNKFKDKCEPLPSFDNQIEMIEEVEQKESSAFSFSQEIIDSVLIEGSQFQNGKFRIYEKFQKGVSNDEIINFLKNEYGIGGRSADKNGISEFHDAKGIKLTDQNTHFEKVLKWNEVQKRIKELIKYDRYLNSKEKELYFKYLEKKEESTKEENDKKIVNKDYKFNVGDKVYIENNEYDIEKLEDTNVILHDSRYPLFTRELTKEEFENKVRENPYNEYLIKGQNDIKIETKVEDNLISKTIVEVNIPTEKEIVEKNNYKINDIQLGAGTLREKFKKNIEAIKILKLCETENRLATKEEQEILSQYVGWGGIQEAFDERNDSWKSEYSQLKNLLTEEEFIEARKTTLTAFYTPPIVIKSMYKALENMGLKNGNILEPSCGIGNFFGMLPESLQNCKLYGIEIDSLSGRIAKQLYQKSKIEVKGFEKTDLPDSFFDVAIGNVPFGNFKVADRKYDKNNFLIHDYFFAKTLDKVRPGGVVAFITSKGTLDKENSDVRKYISRRADLLGAIRLPDNTFKSNANTEVTSDIIFLQKRDSITDIEPNWLDVEENEDGIKINKYFIEHPEMIMGKMVMENSQFGMKATCKADETQDFEKMLDNAILNINSKIEDYAIEDIINTEDKYIPADFNVKNFSYTIVDGQVYFRENSKMCLKELPLTTINRIKGMVEIRDCVRELIEKQLNDCSDEEIKEEQTKLNYLYDKFTKQYGIINSRANNIAFSEDSGYYLLCSLEILNENGELIRKADMFNKRTIKSHKTLTKVDSASEALLLSISEKAKVDLEYMSFLTDKTKAELINELEGVIFQIPNTEVYVTADEYLSGNVREKLKIAKEVAKNDIRFNINVSALEKVIPKDLSASEIDVRLGSTWLPESDIEEFIFELLLPSFYIKEKVKVHFSEYTAQWYIEGKSYDRYNIKVNKTYGTGRVNAYKIIEDTLNLKDVRVYDNVEYEVGKYKRVLNKKETAIAQAKQEQIKSEFLEWIWKDQSRRERLTRLYNDKFNSIRPREYDGSHIKFSGINPEITLRKHQVDAIAQILYGGNTLLAHEVGAGKTFEMVAAAMESKRLGLCNKSLFVVPNHIIEQFASEFLQLYPSANILVTTKKDFATNNRKRFCSKIATGDYDAIIIGHSQFEKIPISAERQFDILQKQIEEIIAGINELKENNGERFSIKQLEKTKRTLEVRLEKLNDQSKKDDVVTFEELGVDKLFIDEAHYFKNLFLYTKMRNVSGISQTEAFKSSDLYMKCRYLDELTDRKGIVFATGTPISNSMVELYTMQRYLQYGDLQEKRLEHFDAWASTFGETTTAIELSPEGNGYRAKTRFAKFYNLPELMSMFKEIANIQTAEMLKLPVPKANYHNIVVKPNELQKEMVAELGKRAEEVRNGAISSSEDNMLKITNDGRKLALDIRLINELLPDFENNKVSVCSNNVFKIWEDTKEKRLTQLIFCDLSTPHKDGRFNVYDDLKQKLIAKGVPEEEIAFIHDAETESKKKELFSKVRKGNVRILIGSTQKMGAGTNVQNKLIALHDLDCPWRPSDLIQRSGRIIRQGNQNEEVNIYRYVTEGTFDAYLYQLVENKQRFISQIMTDKSPVRSAEDIDETALSYAEIKALAVGNPLIIEKTSLDAEVTKLKLLKQSFLSQIYSIEDSIVKYYPSEIKRLEEVEKALICDIQTVNENTNLNEDNFSTMLVNEKIYNKKADAGQAILEMCKNIKGTDSICIGEYRGLKMELYFESLSKQFGIKLKGKYTYNVSLGHDIYGNIARIDNTINAINNELEKTKIKLQEIMRQFENAKEEVKKTFSQEDILKEKSERLEELNILLNLNEKDKQVIDEEFEEVEKSQRCKKDYER